MSIEVANESGTTVNEQSLVALARHVLDDLGVNPLAELSVLLVDLAYMSELNKRWMDGTGPTDVLAFPMDGLDAGRAGPSADGHVEPAMLGDVVLCPAVAARQAAEAGHALEDELHMLCTHGVLHLLGYDHSDPEQEKEMFGVQARLLAGWRQAERGRRESR